MSEITAIPAFDDNYIWLIRNNADTHALVIDPGDAAPVIKLLDAKGLQLSAILVTHHHFDHVGGIAALVERYAPVVIGPANESIPGRTQAVTENQIVSLPHFAEKFRVIEVPGHTLGHIAYYSEDFPQPLLLCGDTLFSAGCGRLFEGTAEQMFQSLNKLAALPGNTQVFCTHEYTLSNLKFALAVEPGNKVIESYAEKVQTLRKQNLPSLPSTIEQELAINPFLRTQELIVKQSAQARTDVHLCEPVQTFATLRQWKNEF